VSFSGGLFGGVFVLQLLLALTATCRRGASKLKAFSPSVFWLLFCFIIHSWIEYNFVFNRTNSKSGFQNGMNLYGAADFRYGFGENLNLEAGTAAMEAITALITGPLCLLLAWGIVGNKPWRWAVQIITCSCQMYGLAWFMAHPFFSIDKVSSDDPFLYWVVFWGFNAPWGIVPPIMLLSAVLHVNKTIAKAQTQAALAAQQVKAALAVKKTK
jgi:cholestenol delta-isomerase